MLPFASYEILFGLCFYPPRLIIIVYYLHLITNCEGVFRSFWAKWQSGFSHCGKWRLDSENIIVFLVAGSDIFCRKMAKFALEFKKIPVLI